MTFTQSSIVYIDTQIQTLNGKYRRKSANRCGPATDRYYCDNHHYSITHSYSYLCSRSCNTPTMEKWPTVLWRYLQSCWFNNRHMNFNRFVAMCSKWVAESAAKRRPQLDPSLFLDDFGFTRSFPVSFLLPPKRQRRRPGTGERQKLRLAVECSWVSEIDHHWAAVVLAAAVLASDCKNEMKRHWMAEKCAYH